MNITITTGGQTGADRGGLDAARACGFPTGGWAPKGWLTERGPDPSLASFGLQESDTPFYPDRTSLNVAGADAIIWYGHLLSAGGRLTARLAALADVPMLLVDDLDAAAVAAFVRGRVPDGGCLMVAGNRESVRPGIAAHVGRHLAEVLHILKETP
jgi:hypothetical protein